jgi:hypothetical protein
MPPKKNINANSLLVRFVVVSKKKNKIKLNIIKFMRKLMKNNKYD